MTHNNKKIEMFILFNMQIIFHLYHTLKKHSFKTLSHIIKKMYSRKQTHASVMTNAKTNANPKTKTNYCKVCADSKKPESIVTSHNVRDPKTNVVLCPTLLAQNCNYCGQSGHTTSYCKIKQKDARIEERETKLAKTKVQTDTAKSRKTGFAALESDSEDDNEEVVIEEFPQVSPYTQPVNTTSTMVGSYASALQREKPQTKPVTRLLPRETTVTREPYVHKKIDWENCESDSSGDEEEE